MDQKIYANVQTDAGVEVGLDNNHDKSCEDNVHDSLAAAIACKTHGNKKLISNLKQSMSH
jgi:hypothetical protein